MNIFAFYSFSFFFLVPSTSRYKINCFFIEYLSQSVIFNHQSDFNPSNLLLKAKESDGNLRPGSNIKLVSLEPLMDLHELIMHKLPLPFQQQKYFHMPGLSWHRGKNLSPVSSPRYVAGSSKESHLRNHDISFNRMLVLQSFTFLGLYR